MVIITYGITHVGKDIHLDGGGAIVSGTEYEERLASCVDTAIRAAMTEIVLHIQDNRLIERKMLEKTARDAVQAFLRIHKLQ